MFIITAVSPMVIGYNVETSDIDLIEDKEKTKLSNNPPEEQWNKTFGGNNSDRGHYCQLIGDGGYIITGHTYSYGNGGYDVWLIKTDVNGDEEWNRTFGGGNDDTGVSVNLTREGGYIIVGATRSYGNGNEDVWLIKTDANGNEVWNKTFGKEYRDWGWSVKQTIDEGYIITGWIETYEEHVGDLWLIKTDANGNEVWNKTFGGEKNEYGYSIQQTSGGKYIILGCTSSYGSGSDDVWLIKTDANGNEIWNKTFGGPNYDIGASIDKTKDGGLIIGAITETYGSGEADVWLIKTDSNGCEQWNKTFGGINDDRGISVQQTDDEGYIITGYTNSYGAGNDDVWLIKVAPEYNQPPSVEIINPKEGYFHFSGIPLFPRTLNLFINTMSIGGFRLNPIIINATDDVDNSEDLIVKIYLNGEEQGNASYCCDWRLHEWFWTELALGTYTLTVTAEDSFGAVDSAEMDVWNFCFFP